MELIIFFSKSQWLKILIGFFLSGICLFYITTKIDFNIILKLSEFNGYNFIFIASLSLILGYTFRVCRWYYILNKIDQPNNSSLLIPTYFASIALNNILPLRLGDIIRVIFFSNFIGIRKISNASSLFIEKIYDIIWIILILFLTIFILNFEDVIKQNAFLFFTIPIIIFFLFLLVRTDFKVFLRTLNYTRITKQIIKFLNQTKLLFELKNFLIISLITIAVWFFEAGLYWYMFLSLDIKSNFVLALLIMSTATLSTMFPSTPGYFGTFHLAIISVLSLSIDNNEIITMYAILTHLNLWLTTTLIGIFLILLNLDLFKSIKMRNFHQYVTKFKNGRL